MSTSFNSIFAFIVNVFGVFQPAPKLYDVIVVGAGAGGCPLAQTMAENGLSVLLLERGGEQVYNSQQIMTSIKALTDDCAESIRSTQGHTVTTGNCMGGATSVNHGIYVQEQPEWVQNITKMYGNATLTIEEIVDAYDWIRSRVAPEPSGEPIGSPSALYEQDLINIYSNRSDFHVGNTNGQPTVEMGGVWRTHSTFDPVTQKRRSSNTVLDRDNPNLTVKTKAKVSKVVYDGDELIPFRVRSSISQQQRNQRQNQRQSTLATARCVRLTSLEVYCVRYGGRIYISSGVIHTPHVLINSGIGPNGTVVDNPNVGQNLVDKPAMLIAGSFQPGFDPNDHLAFAHVAATRIGVGGVHLWEDLNNGVDSMLLLASWQRNFVPVSLRNSWFATAAVELIDFCDQNIDNDPTPSIACNQMVPLVRAGCYKNIVGVASLIAEPSSRGTVTIQNGQVKVDVNYLATDIDLQAFGATIRTAHEVMSSFTGRTAMQQPCADKTDTECMKQSCPELIKDYVDYTYRTLRLAMPSQASKMRLAPASMLYPQFVEPALADENNDDLAIGKIVRDDIFAAHHFAGTAAVGTVVDSSKDFAVMGVEGLHVIDASMLQTTTRCNPMATVMALGHIAGLQAVDALSSASSRRTRRIRS